MKMLTQEPFPLNLNQDAQLAISVASAAANEKRDSWQNGLEKLEFADTIIRNASDGKLSLFDEIQKPASANDPTLPYYVIKNPTYQQGSVLSVQRIIIFPNIAGGSIEITQNTQNTVDGKVTPTRRPFKPEEDDALVQMVLNHKLDAVLPNLPTKSPTFPLQVPTNPTG